MAMRYWLLAIGCWLLAVACCAGDAVTVKAVDDIADGVQGFTVTAPGYTAKVSKEGQITSLKLGDLEVFDGSIALGMGGKHEKPDFVKLLDPQTIELTFPSRPIATLKFGEQSFTIAIKQKKKNWDFGLFFTVSSRAQTATSKGRDFKDVALPLLQGRTAYEDADFLFDDGSMLKFKETGPGNSINSDENGSIVGFSWARKCLEINGNYTFTFTFEKGAPGTKKLSAPPFVIRAVRVGNIYAPGEPVALNLEVRPALCQKLAGIAEDLVVECSSRDMWGQPAGTQEFPVDFAKLKADAPAPAAGGKAKPIDPAKSRPAMIPVQFQIAKKGWFETTVTLKDKQGKVIPTSEKTAISIVTPNPGLLNPPLPEKPGTYEFNAFMGLTCHRESFNLDQIFSQSANTERPSAPGASVDTKPGADAVKDLALDEGKKKEEKPAVKDVVAKWDNLDKQFEASVAAQKKYGFTAFWLMEPPRNWWLLKEPARVEQALFQLISRYKDKNKYWMLLNEPNLGMSPKDYVNNYLLPLNRAAKRADPEAKVFGPDTCGLNPGWLEEVYKAGGKMDIIDMHPYSGHQRGWEEHGMTDAWKKVRDVMAAHGDGAKEMWSTESGFDWSLGRLGKNHHAKNIVRGYPLAESVGIPKNHFFLYYTCSNGFIKFYLVEHDQTLLPGGVAARVQSEQLAGAAYVGPKDAGKDKYAFLYRGKDEDVWMLWSNDCKTTCSVEIASKKIVVTDMMGNQLTDYPASAAAKQTVAFQLSGYPIYVRVDKGAACEPVKEDLGPNLARGDGVKVTASSEDKGCPATKVVDGVWNSENTGSYEGKIWVSKSSMKSEKEAWLEIALPQKQNVGRVHVYCPTSICGMCGLRSFAVQAFDAAKNDWKTVAEVKDSEEAWVFHIPFASVNTDRIRILITDLNNGFFLDDKRNYTDMKAKVSEVEIYATK